MRIGVVILPDDDWPALHERFVGAEQRGFATAWTYDHLSWRTLRDDPWLGTMPLLAAAAATTSRIRLGTLVTSPNFRHPGLLAKDVMTIDRISNGRVDLGIGAGGVGWDAVVLGNEPLEPAARTDRFVEFVDAMDVLLREQSVSIDGEYFTVEESRTIPGCVQQPRVPFTVAAAGSRAMRVAAEQGSTWVTYGPIPETDDHEQWYAGVAEQMRRLDAACADVGRDPSTIRRLALAGLEHQWANSSVAAWDEFVHRIAEIGFTDVAVHWPRPHDPDLPGASLPVFEAISQRISDGEYPAG